MKIYSKQGDTGDTQVLGGNRVSKSDPRVQLFGDLDELNSAIGVALSCQIQGNHGPSFSRIQQELFECGAVVAGARPSKHSPPNEFSVRRLEDEIDQWDAQLPPLTHFILPGGAPSAAAIHFARTVCRRAERSCVELLSQTDLADLPEPKQEAADLLGQLLKYLNRLSDWLFVAARYENQVIGCQEVRWVPSPPSPPSPPSQ